MSNDTFKGSTIIMVDSLEKLQGLKYPPNVDIYAVVLDKTQSVDPASPPVMSCVAAELGGTMRNFNFSTRNGVATIYKIIRQPGSDVISTQMVTSVNPDKYKDVRL